MAGNRNLGEKGGNANENQRIGKPFSTDRELVEEGKSRKGTNLDIGEERSEEQKQIKRDVQNERSS